MPREIPLPPDVIDDLARLSKMLGKSRKKVLTQAVKEFIERQETDKTFEDLFPKSTREEIAALKPIHNDMDKL